MLILVYHHDIPNKYLFIFQRFIDFIVLYIHSISICYFNPRINEGRIVKAITDANRNNAYQEQILISSMLLFTHQNPENKSVSKHPFINNPITLQRMVTMIQLF